MWLYLAHAIQNASLTELGIWTYKEQSLLPVSYAVEVPWEGNILMVRHNISALCLFMSFMHRGHNSSFSNTLF
jgi:hypothetical protein